MPFKILCIYYRFIGSMSLYEAGINKESLPINQTRFYTLSNDTFKKSFKRFRSPSYAGFAEYTMIRNFAIKIKT